MKKTAILIMILTIFSKVFGFLRDIILSYFYGASNISDAYLISLTIPGVIFSFVGIGVSTSYIPMYNRIADKNGKEEANRYTNNLINILVILSTLIVIIGILFANKIVRIFALGFDNETLTLAVRFTRISIMGVYFTSITYVAKGFLELKGNYTLPAVMSIPFNFIIILFIFISVETNVMLLSLGTLIATGLQLLLLIPSMYKKGYNYKVTLNLKDEYIKTMTLIALPTIIGTSVNQINKLVDRTLASTLTIGGISALNYASKLNGFIQGIFVMSIVTVLYPLISKMITKDNINGLKKAVCEAIVGINLLVVPAAIGSMVFAEPIVKILFGRGAFDDYAISLTSFALLFYSLGMIGFGLREVLSRVFYSMQDTKTPMVNATIGMMLNIFLNIILSKFLGIGGLALATSISATFTTILLFISLRKKIGPFGMKNISMSFIKILCTSLVMGLIAKVSYNALLNSIGANLSLLLSIVIGALTYFAIIYFMKIEEVDAIVNAVKKKLRRSVVNE